MLYCKIPCNTIQYHAISCNASSIESTSISRAPLLWILSRVKIFACNRKPRQNQWKIMLRKPIGPHLATSHMRATGNFAHNKKGVSQSGSKSGIWVGGRIDGSHPPEIRSLVKVCLHSVPYTPNIYQTIPWCVYILRPLPKQISQWPRPDCHPETPWIAANFGNFCEKMRQHLRKKKKLKLIPFANDNFDIMKQSARQKVLKHEIKQMEKLVCSLLVTNTFFPDI